MHLRGLKTLGVVLCVALGLMVLAVGAGAENLKDGGKAGKFRVAGSSALAKGVKFLARQEGPSKMLIASKNAYIECKNGVAEGEGTGESEITATMTSEECKVFEDKSPFPELTGCPVESEGEGKGRFKTKWNALPKLHEGELYILFDVDATIKFGPECGIGVKVLLSGSVVALVVNGSNEEKVHLITFSEAIQKLFQVINGSIIEGDKLLYGAAEMFLGSSWNMEPTGIHLGQFWSVI